MCINKLILKLETEEGKVLYTTEIPTEPGKEGGTIRLLDSVLEETFSEGEEES